MMRSTKITIAIALGLTSAVALGLVMVSSSAEADTDPSLTVHADDSFTGQTLQFRQDGATMDNINNPFPQERKYTRSKDMVYDVRVKNTGALCKFVSTSEYAGEHDIPDAVSKVYLQLDGSYCDMDTNPFYVEPPPVEPPPVEPPPVEPAPGEPAKLSLEVYSKGVAALPNPMTIVLSEFDNSGNYISKNEKQIQIDYWYDALLFQPSLSFEEGQGYSEMKVTGNGYDIKCAFDDPNKTEKITLTEANVLIDAEENFCLIQGKNLKVTNNYAHDQNYDWIIWYQTNQCPPETNVHYRNWRDHNDDAEFNVEKDGRATCVYLSLQETTETPVEYCYLDGDYRLSTYITDITLTKVNSVCTVVVNK